MSEFAAVGFEYGYSVEWHEAFVAWEAQFGDFGNGAQVIIDQFIAAGEAKWGQQSGLTLLLPHGYEGQGPEHSSGRIERFLELCANENMRVVVPSTTGQYFHLLRRQALLRPRKPLIVFTPKSLLRTKESFSPLEVFTTGRFEPVLEDGVASSGRPEAGALLGQGLPRPRPAPGRGRIDRCGDRATRPALPPRDQRPVRPRLATSGSRTGVVSGRAGEHGGLPLPLVPPAPDLRSRAALRRTEGRGFSGHRFVEGAQPGAGKRSSTWLSGSAEAGGDPLPGWEVPGLVERPRPARSISQVDPFLQSKSDFRVIPLLIIHSITAGITSPCEQRTALVPANSRKQIAGGFAPFTFGQGRMLDDLETGRVGKRPDGLDASNVGAAEYRLDPARLAEDLGQTGGLAASPCPRGAGGWSSPVQALAVAGGAVANQIKSAGGEQGVDVDSFEQLAGRGRSSGEPGPRRRRPSGSHRLRCWA